MKYSRGFTLVELMVTLAVAAIILGFAVPSFQALVENNRVTSEANRLLGAMQFARSEAVRLGETVSLSAVSNDFNNGWCVHRTANCTGSNILRQFAAPASAFSSAAASVSFSARGERTPQAGGNIVISVQPTDCDVGEVARRSTVTVGLSGLVRLTRGDCA